MEAPEVPGASYGKGLRLSNHRIDIYNRTILRPRSDKHRCRASEVVGSRLAFASKVRERTGYSKQQDGRRQIILRHSRASATTWCEAYSARTAI